MIQVTVPITALLGVDDRPGQLPTGQLIPAAVVRDLISHPRHRLPPPPQRPLRPPVGVFAGDLPPEGGCRPLHPRPTPHLRHALLLASRGVGPSPWPVPVCPAVTPPQPLYLRHSPESPTAPPQPPHLSIPPPTRQHPCTPPRPHTTTPQLSPTFLPQHHNNSPTLQRYLFPRPHSTSPATHTDPPPPTPTHHCHKHARHSTPPYRPPQEHSTSNSRRPLTPLALQSPR